MVAEGAVRWGLAQIKAEELDDMVKMMDTDGSVSPPAAWNPPQRTEDGWNANVRKMRGAGR